MPKRRKLPRRNNFKLQLCNNNESRMSKHKAKPKQEPFLAKNSHPRLSARLSMIETWHRESG